MESNEMFMRNGNVLSNSIAWQEKCHYEQVWKKRCQIQWRSQRFSPLAMIPVWTWRRLYIYRDPWDCWTRQSSQNHLLARIVQLSEILLLRTPWLTSYSIWRICMTLRAPGWVEPGPWWHAGMVGWSTRISHVALVMSFKNCNLGTRRN